MNKRQIFGSERCEESDSDYAADEDHDDEMRDTKATEEGGQMRGNANVWFRPVRDEVKLIDFGGATYEEEYHTSIINTRQYRAPEVILGK